MSHLDYPSNDDQFDDRPDDDECICDDPNDPTPDCNIHGVEAMNERAAWLDETKANDQ